MADEQQKVQRYGVILAWRKDPMQAGSLFKTAFCVTGNIWWNTVPAPKETIDELPEKFPKKTRIQFTTRFNEKYKKEEVLIGTIEKQPVMGSAEPEKSEDENDQTTLPEAVGKAVKDYKSVEDFQFQEQLKWFKRDRKILRHVLIKEAGESVRQKDMPLSIQPEEIMNLVKKMETEFEKQFPDEKAPER